MFYFPLISTFLHNSGWWHCKYMELAQMQCCSSWYSVNCVWGWNSSYIDAHCWGRQIIGEKKQHLCCGIFSSTFVLCSPLSLFLFLSLFYSSAGQDINCELYLAFSPFPIMCHFLFIIIFFSSPLQLALVLLLFVPKLLLIWSLNMEMSSSFLFIYWSNGLTCIFI